MNRWLRLILAAAALIAFAAPLVPLAAGTNAACACAMRCCCSNPKGAGEGCRLSRPCGADENAAVPSVGSFRPAVIDVAVPRPVPPGVVARVAAVSDRQTHSLSEPPPVPPPRPLSSC